MPANLTQQYRKAEQEYRQAATPDEELSCLQAMLRELPKHKGTDKLQAELKQKISKAKKETDSARSSKKSHGLRILRQGAGRIVLIGGPNAGKSSLLSALTRATPEVAAYPFTTREPNIGMMPWEDVTVQLIDAPPITLDHLESYTQGLIRGADLVLLVVDLGNDDGIEQCQEVLDRLQATRTRLSTESFLDEADMGLSHTRTFVVANKSDAPDFTDRLELFHELCSLDFVEYPVSTVTGDGLEELREGTYRALDVVRVYTKSPKEKRPDYEKPYTIRRGQTLLEVAEQIHRELATQMRFARVWGSHIHDGTHVKADYVPHDQDVVELHM